MFYNDRIISVLIETLKIESRTVKKKEFQNIKRMTILKDNGQRFRRGMISIG